MGNWTRVDEGFDDYGKDEMDLSRRKAKTSRKLRIFCH